MIARAMAKRCCPPPENAAGLWMSRSASRHGDHSGRKGRTVLRGGLNSTAVVWRRQSKPRGVFNGRRLLPARASAYVLGQQSSVWEADSTSPLPIKLALKGAATPGIRRDRARRRNICNCAVSARWWRRWGLGAYGAGMHGRSCWTLYPLLAHGAGGSRCPSQSRCSLWPLSASCPGCACWSRRTRGALRTSRSLHRPVGKNDPVPTSFAPNVAGNIQRGHRGRGSDANAAASCKDRRNVSPPGSRAYDSNLPAAAVYIHFTKISAKVLIVIRAQADSVRQHRCRLAARACDPNAVVNNIGTHGCGT